MSEPGEKGRATRRGGEQLTVTLPVELHEKLSGFCREMMVSPDLVVVRALTDYS